MKNTVPFDTPLKSVIKHYKNRVVRYYYCYHLSSVVHQGEGKEEIGIGAP